MQQKLSLKALLAFTVVASACFAATAAFADNVITKIQDNGTVCKAVFADEKSPHANAYEGLKVYKNNVLLREVGIRNNVWQMPIQVSLTLDCDVLALYPEYDHRFQNLFKNGTWVKDLPTMAISDNRGAKSLPAGNSSSESPDGAVPVEGSTLAGPAI